MKNIIESKWTVEGSILIFTFILFTLNDWILISSWKSFFMGIIYFLVLYGHAQLNRFLLLPLLTVKHKTWMYVLCSLVFLCLFTIVLHYLTETVLYRNCYLHRSPVKLSYQYQFGVILGSFICIVGAAQFIEYYRNRRNKDTREIISNKSQIDFLTKQLNPHFLFNTLNTIYGVSLKYPDRTSDLILKVSELLRYQVENTKKEMVSIENELDFILSYIELEKERVGYRTQVSFEYDIDRKAQYEISSMLLFTFIENAFKHGTCNIEYCFVKIGLFVKDGILTLSTSNSVPLKKPKVASTRVGLENTRSRLQMLYPEKHRLEVHSGSNRYDVLLEIEL